MSLPSYDQVKTPPPSETAQPTTLYVAGRFIHQAGDPEAPPLYELSHSVGFLRDSDHKVELSRLEYRVGGSAGTAGGARAPRVVSRSRHLFDLTHRTLAELPTYTFQAETKSRAALACLGIERFRAPRWLGQRVVGGRRGFRIVTARWGKDMRLVGEPDALFTAVATSSSGADRDGVSWQWRDGSNAIVARELMDRDGLLSLLITAEMGVALRDALVASWILRHWWDSANEKESARGLRHRGKSILLTGGKQTSKTCMAGW